MDDVSGNLHYNLGLIYFQLQEFGKAREQAYKALDLGYDLDGLKNMLIRVGQWRESSQEKNELLQLMDQATPRFLRRVVR